VASRSTSFRSASSRDRCRGQPLGDDGDPSRRPSPSRLMMAHTSVSTIVFRLTFSPNSSPISVSVAPAALRFRGRDVRLAAIEMTMYQRSSCGVDHQVLDELDADVAAVWKPNVSMSAAGRGRCHRLRHVHDPQAAADFSDSFIAENAVSSPPIVINWVTPSFCSVATRSPGAPDPSSDWRGRCR